MVADDVLYRFHHGDSEEAKSGRQPGVPTPCSDAYRAALGTRFWAEAPLEPR